MKNLLNSNALSLIIVKLIFFSAFVVIFYIYNNQSNQEKLKGLTIQSKEEYIANYDKYADDLEAQKTEIERDINNLKNPFVFVIAILILIVGYIVYQIIQLGIAVYVWDKVRFKLGIKYRATPLQSEDDILDNISV